MKVLMKKLCVISLALAINNLSPALATETDGGNAGGGGSNGARIFTEAAKNAAIALLQSKSTESYGLQLLETLETVVIRFVPTLNGVCDGQPKPANLYAYSCPGKIYLKDSVWLSWHAAGGNLRRLPFRSKYESFNNWLVTESGAYGHLTDIIHEVFRAGDPRSSRFVTHDEAYHVSREIITENSLFDNFASNCSLGSDCLKPFPEEVLEQTFECRESSKGPLTELSLNIIGIQGTVRTINFSTFENVGLCKSRMMHLESKPSSLFGKNYLCSTFTGETEAGLYVMVINPNFTHFKRSLVYNMPLNECQKVATRKWLENRQHN